MVRLGGCTAMVGVVLLLLGCSHGKKTNTVLSPIERDIESLSWVAFVYVEDGACDGHVTDADSPYDRAIVRRLLCKEAIPFLIDHLGDFSPTCSVYRRGKTITLVPVGYLCLDLVLLMSADHSPVFVDGGNRTYSDDAFWPSAREGCFFEPGVLLEKGAAVKMKKVQRAWQGAYDTDRLKFDIEECVRKMDIRLRDRYGSG